MRIVAMLSWYDEDPEWLEECVARVAGVADHVVAVEGRYRGFPDEPLWTPQELAAAIVSAGVPVTVHVPWCAWPSEVAKRDFMLQLAMSVGADWLFRVDADELVTSVPGDLRARLAATSRNVAEVMLDESPPGTSGPLRALFRAVPGIRVSHAHNLVTAPAATGGRVVLAGEHSHYALDPAEQIHDVRVEHHRLRRPWARQEQKESYYRVMPQLETRMTVGEGT